MKKLLAVLCAAMMLLACAGCGNTTATEPTPTPDTTVVDEGFSMEGFSEWALAGGNAGTLSGQFLSGAENRPTDEELETILQTANTYFQCHGLTGAHFIVIKDTDEQNAIVPTFFGNDTTGTVTILVMSDGLKDQEHHVNQYYPGSTDVNGGNPEYWHMYYGIYESGWASAYLNLAAIELGYRTRAYAALTIPGAESGVVNMEAGGDFSLIQGENWDIQKYMSTKDGSEEFDHYVMALDEEIPAEGNLTLLCAIVIGKVDETDTTTSATGSLPHKDKMKYNYDFWDKDYNPASTDSTSSASTDSDSGATAEGEE